MINHDFIHTAKNLHRAGHGTELWVACPGALGGQLPAVECTRRGCMGCMCPVMGDRLGGLETPMPGTEGWQKCARSPSKQATYPPQVQHLQVQSSSQHHSHGF